ncbi:hypothetical protein C8N46_103368 [Kordia periserrulae]|uniref:Uncharacterized protein n=1 Tax=Kordia periserrulae TaxID=701523 RepID=A0A2T6C1U8_9FLAO|nr:hypothetical protein C8N46_103368 [Kordia periserrulae]
MYSEEILYNIHNVYACKIFNPKYCILEINISVIDSNLSKSAIASPIAAADGLIIILSMERMVLLAKTQMLLPDKSTRK